MLAMLWAASGSLFSDRYVVNPHPTPPPAINFVVQTWDWNAMWKRPEAEDEPLPQIQTVQFSLKHWSPSGEVAHYELSNQPPKGWEWLIQKEKIIARKLPLDSEKPT